MKLSEVNEMIKADLMKFVNGDYNNHFTKDQLEFATERSFLLNHITVVGDSVIFEYNKDRVKISGLHDIPSGFSEESIIHYIKSENIFKSAYKSFLREHKLNKLLN
jgi:hypothetical protein